MRNRKITFTNIGVVQGSRVWRNSETGVEIIKGKNFAEVGLYYVCVPTRTAEGRMVVATRNTLTGARGAATYYVDCQMRASIAKAYTEACLEDSDRDGARLMAQRTTHYRSPELGYQACGEMYSSEGLTEVRGEVTCQRCRDRYNSAYWEQATEGMPRVPAFTEATQ